MPGLIFPLWNFAAIDVDCILEYESLLKMVKPFMNKPNRIVLSLWEVLFESRIPAEVKEENYSGKPTGSDDSQDSGIRIYSCFPAR